jgi:PAS domain S-box-containing protein
MLKKIIHQKQPLSQSKKGKYSARLSDALVSGNHESFRTNDNFYRMLVQSLIGYAIFTTDKEGNISSWNDGAAKLLGYSENEIIGKNASTLYRLGEMGKTQLQKDLEKAAKKGKVVVERYHVQKNGFPLWASGVIFSLGDEKDVARGFTFIVRDLTEKMEFEKRKDAFISTATHELKTPVTSMKLYAQIVEREVMKSGIKTNIQSFHKLNQQLDKLITLMDYLLDVDKVQTGKLQLVKKSFDINILVDETIATIHSVSKNHTLVQEGKIQGKVCGDRERIAQVLANLITNAVKYSPGSNKTIIIGLKEDGRSIVISVKDFGLGISELEQPALFGRFYRASGAIENKIEGIGLGLYVAQQIIVAHNGKMWLESKKDEGSTFYFSIPKK